MRKAAFFAYEGCAIWQVALVLHLLCENDWLVRTLTLGATQVTAAGGINVRPNIALEHASPRDFDLFLAAGGPISAEFADDTRVHRYLRQFDGHRGHIAVTGTATLFVAAAGLLGGLSFTGDSDCIQTYPEWFNGAIYTGSDVTTDANVTSAKSTAHVAWTSMLLRQLGYDSTLYKHRVQTLAGLSN